MQVTCKRCSAQFHLARNPGSAKLRCPSCQWYFQLDDTAAIAETNQYSAESASSSQERGELDPYADPAPIPPRDNNKPVPSNSTKSEFWKWTGFTVLITALLLVYPITEYSRYRRANQDHLNAINSANAWLKNESLDGFEQVYRELSNCIGNSRVPNKESVVQLREQIVEKRDALYAEQKRLDAETAIAERDWQQAESLLLEYLIEGFGDQEELVRTRLAEVQNQLAP